MIPRSIRNLLSLAAFAAAAAVAAPTEIIAEYRLIHTGFTIGRINETFVRNGEGYAATSTTRSEGALKVLLDDQLTLASAGRVGAAGLQPHTFSQVRAKDHVRDIKSVFDWDKGVMRTSLRAETTETPLAQATQDRLSVMYNFMHLPSYAETLFIPLAINRRIDPYTYRKLGEEKLTTPAGDFDTLHYQRVGGKPSDMKVDVWLAKNLSHFPVRAIFDDPKGFKLEQLIEKVQVK